MRNLLWVAAVVVCFAPVSRAADEENPFKKAKVGDWAAYKMSASAMGQSVDIKVKMTVGAKDDKEATIKTSVIETVNKKEVERPGQESKIDLSKPYDATNTANLPKNAEAKVEKIAEGNDKVHIGGKDYDCTFQKLKITAKVNGVEANSEITIWVSKSVPLSGLVKMEMKSKDANMSMELTETGEKK